MNLFKKITGGVLVIIILAVVVNIFGGRIRKNLVPEGSKVGEIKVVNMENEEVETENVAGMVKKWNGESGILTLITAGQDVDFIIDKQQTRVMIGRSRNQYNNNSIFILEGEKKELHWPSAFCVGDQASLLIDKKNGTVVWAMDTDLRSCGFREGLK